MSAPSPPQINPLPRVDPTSIQFWWDPPLSDGGSPVLDYTLACASPALTFTVDPTQNTFLVPGLTTGISYAFTITANNTNGSSTPATFRQVICGTFPSPPQNVGISSVGASGCKIQWDVPVSDGGAALKYYAVTADPLYPAYVSSIQFGAPATQTQRFTNGQTVGQNFQYIVNAINDPGWSDPVSTSYSLFTPSNLPEIKVWLDAGESTSLVYNVNGVITQWGNKATGPGFASDPTRSNILVSTVFGGFPTVAFQNATGSYFASDDPGTPMIPNNTCVFFAVVSSITEPIGSGSNFVFTSLTQLPPNGNFMMLDGTTSPSSIVTTIGYTPNSISEDQISPYKITDPFIYSYSYGTTETGFGYQQSFYNGATKTQTYFPGKTAGNGFVLGNQPDVNHGDGLNGYLSEFIFCTGDVSQSDRQKTEGYLAWKWGLNNRLPPSHPYYSAPPPP